MIGYVCVELDPNVPREGAKMDAAEIRQNFVCSQEELDAHFLAAASAEMVGMVAESPVRYGEQH